MPADFKRVRHVLPKFKRGDYYALMRSIANCFSEEETDVVKLRLKVLTHMEEHGWRSACDAFSLSRGTLYNWRKKYLSSSKRLSSLIPRSTRPHNTRVMTLDPRLVSFIRQMREEYGRVSKYKLKVFLDEYASSLGISAYGLDKIAKIIKRNHYFFERKKIKRKVKLLSPRLKRAPRQTLPGYLEMDSITIYINSKKLYFITVIDVVTKFAWVRLTQSLSGKEALKTLEEFAKVYTYPVHTVQTDNGHEFLGDFHKYLGQRNIIHEFIYPRSPKVNGVVERFNRTIQEEFLERSDELYTQEWEKFNQRLLKYLTWYNTRRPHHSLKLKPPIIFLKQF